MPQAYVIIKSHFRGQDQFRPGKRDDTAESSLKQGRILLGNHNSKQPDRHSQNRLDKNDRQEAKQVIIYIDTPL